MEHSGTLNNVERSQGLSTGLVGCSSGITARRPGMPTAPTAHLDPVPDASPATLSSQALALLNSKIAKEEKREEKQESRSRSKRSRSPLMRVVGMAGRTTARGPPLTWLDEEPRWQPSFSWAFRVCSLPPISQTKLCKAH